MRQENVEQIRRAFTPGTVIELEEMAGEPQMPSGIRGKVRFVDDIGQVHMFWENGSRLALHPQEDRFRIQEKVMEVVLVSPKEGPRVIRVKEDEKTMEQLLGKDFREVGDFGGIVMLCSAEETKGLEPNVLLYDPEGEVSQVISGDVILCCLSEEDRSYASVPKQMQHQLLEAFSLPEKTRSVKERDDRGGEER